MSTVWAISSNQPCRLVASSNRWTIELNMYHTNNVSLYKWHYFSSVSVLQYFVLKPKIKWRPGPTPPELVLATKITNLTILWQHWDIQMWFFWALKQEKNLKSESIHLSNQTICHWNFMSKFIQAQSNICTTGHCITDPRICWLLKFNYDTDARGNVRKHK